MNPSRVWASPLAMTADDVALLGRTRPLVLLGERLSRVAVDHVAIDSVAAARAATAHLIEALLVEFSRHPIDTGAHAAYSPATIARAYLKAHEDAIRRVECGDVAQAYDIDTEADLVHLE